LKFFEFELPTATTTNAALYLAFTSNATNQQQQQLWLFRCLAASDVAQWTEMVRKGLRTAARMHFHVSGFNVAEVLMAAIIKQQQQQQK